jgi:peptide deformylase
MIDGAEFTLECGGLLARAVQHEVDHLDGILFVDRLDADELGKVKARLNRLRRSAGKVGFQRRAVA